MNSSMIATEPLPPSSLGDHRLGRPRTLGDMAHAYMYAQRTADDRIALGGRGVPYRFGSRTDDDGRTQPARSTPSARSSPLLPHHRGVRIDHAWSGVLGVPRDWCATVTLDRSTGLGWAGGYVGSGVATTNLAARTLRDLIQRTPARRATPADHAALGQPQGPQVGAGAVSLARRAGHVRRLPRGRPPRGGGSADTYRIARLADRVAGRR